ncbi:MAG TPA: hypothetical protein VHY20_05915, partial [Pirellulales bacterium]|nr:hypothetical protein [Pirellulales bacterium]
MLASSGRKNRAAVSRVQFSGRTDRMDKTGSRPDDGRRLFSSRLKPTEIGLTSQLLYMTNSAREPEDPRTRLA